MTVEEDVVSQVYADFNTALLAPARWTDVQNKLDPTVVVHLTGTDKANNPIQDDIVGAGAVVTFLQGLVGGPGPELINVATHGQPGVERVVATNRTTGQVGERAIDHICADSFRLAGDPPRIVEAWITLAAGR